MTGKSNDNQPTADHAVGFTCQPVLFDSRTRQLSRSNNQTHQKQINDLRSNPIPSYQHPEEQGTPVTRMSAVIPHSLYHTPRSTILRDSSLCDIVLMTSQHVTVTTKLNRPPAHFHQGALWNKKNRSAPLGYFAAEFQAVAVVLMLKV